MTDIAIRVENLSKRFRIGSRQPYHRLSEVATNLGRSVLQMPRRLRRGVSTGDGSEPVSVNGSDEFWALKDVSFEVKQGEVVGIIGRNGAGKSTLLKILSRITEPTSGRFGVRGRVGSLLEVGTGFHPELTGRENIFLSGTILGMTRREVKRHLDEIIDFADIEGFLDTPVKRYSSGMKVRLGFAVAAHLQPEILIVDEVLAVGDAQFQKKCLGKMGDVAKSGRTVLFVSHNMAAVRQLTVQSVLLAKGKLEFYGDTDQAIDAYATLACNAARTVKSTDKLEDFRRDRKDESPVRLIAVDVQTSSSRSIPVPNISFRDDFTVVFEIESRIKTTVRMGFSLHRNDGVRAVLVWSEDSGAPLSLTKGRQSVRCQVRNLPLTPGR